MLVAILKRSLCNNQSNAIIRNHVASIFTTAEKRVKEIRIKEDDNQITIEGCRIESDRKDQLIKLSHSTCACPLCRLNLKRLEYSDVLILSQFTESNGRLMSQPDTGLCSNSYRKVKSMVNQAHSAMLLPRPPEYKSYGPWDDLNHYYEFPRRIRDRPKSVIKKEYWK
ncbi:mitochondrial ribosomal protein S18A [Dermatophagoides pteronyssinus]|uniref:28S ribosomal protein S18a, mitochondrial-like n=2 Tax=Dermatophagoides pteronyssinus TaxID=6956 RepID=A0A6P6Y2B3_DERPT|nr:28S ribosomal protein S18a, mitochondrial-like [Dermatophagoides pteronyssinus]KAH9423143.1 Structural constituent of ribosome [Dermatophagoides pteronyssinus]